MSKKIIATSSLVLLFCSALVDVMLTNCKNTNSFVNLLVHNYVCFFHSVLVANAAKPLPPPSPPYSALWAARTLLQRCATNLPPPPLEQRCDPLVPPVELASALVVPATPFHPPPLRQHPSLSPHMRTPLSHLHNPQLLSYCPHWLFKIRSKSPDP